MIKSTLLQKQHFLKVIAGIENFNASEIREVALAANGIADAIDLSADQASVEWVKANTDLTVFVSSLEPQTLIDSLEWGTDWVELGNFQPIYDRGALINPEMVMQWTHELVAGLQGRAGICVTIPGVLTLNEQVKLAQAVEAAGADLIQIENITGDLSHVAPIQAAVTVPVMVAGKLDHSNLAKALETGAKGYGIGQAVRQSNDMRGYIQDLQAVTQPASALI